MATIRRAPVAPDSHRAAAATPLAMPAGARDREASRCCRRYRGGRCAERRIRSRRASRPTPAGFGRSTCPPIRTAGTSGSLHRARARRPHGGSQRSHGRLHPIDRTTRLTAPPGRSLVLRGRGWIDWSSLAQEGFTASVLLSSATTTGVSLSPPQASPSVKRNRLRKQEFRESETSPSRHRRIGGRIATMSHDDSSGSNRVRRMGSDVSGGSRDGAWSW